MNYYFITGTSKGLGKSLASLLLKEEDNFIYGLSRSCSIEHQRYIHINIDLSNLEQVLGFKLPTLQNAKKIVLINNAGIVGDINHVGKLNNQKIIDCYATNLIAPSVLINNFISKYSQLDSVKTILNISSGAGRNPIDGWSVYCSTKAGIDMFSRVLVEENKINATKTKVLSLAPGIIDTEMQTEIRNSDKSAFSNIERFKEYKKTKTLVNPEDTAKQVLRFINEDDVGKNVLCSVRDL